MIAAGAADCLRWPLTLDVLRNKIRWYLEAKWIKQKLKHIVRKEEIKDIDRQIKQLESNQHQNQLEAPSLIHGNNDFSSEKKNDALQEENSELHKKIMNYETTISELESRNSKL